MRAIQFLLHRPPGIEFPLGTVEHLCSHVSSLPAIPRGTPGLDGDCVGRLAERSPRARALSRVRSRTREEDVMRQALLRCRLVPLHVTLLSLICGMLGAGPGAADSVPP